MKAGSVQKWSPLSAWGSRGASSGDEVLLQFFTAFRLRRHKVTTDQSALWPAAHGAPARSAEALEYSPLPLAQGVPSPGIGRKEWAKKCRTGPTCWSNTSQNGSAAFPLNLQGSRRTNGSQAMLSVRGKAQ